VKAGGKQEKVGVGDVVVLNLLHNAVGEEVSLTPVLLVDGEEVTASPKKLAKVSVKAEVLGHQRGKKINIFTYKNKGGRARRMGHRQELTRIKITGIA
jgi:large subunit ribosomal protein L21